MALDGSLATSLTAAAPAAPDLGALMTDFLLRRHFLKALGAGAAVLTSGCAGTGGLAAHTPVARRSDVLAAMAKANRYYQTTNPAAMWSFWDIAAYHTGNMYAYELVRDPAWRAYSEAWAEHNQWKGAKSDDRAKWKLNYGETDEHVLFGDWQICFQTYIDLYRLEVAEGRPADPRKIARAREVMEYQMSTARNDYWWWADGLYMVMPVMTRLHKITGNPLYLQKLDEYFRFADDLMYDREAKLYYRDAKYVWPKHKSANGKKDFWARGDGWVFAGFARVLADLPANDPRRPMFEDRFKSMAKVLAAVQRPEGYWTRSLLDPEHAPGPETSGTAFFTFGFLWGLNHGLLSADEVVPVVTRSWNYLTRTALQADGKLGYVQPIGERAIPGQTVNVDSTAPFGVGAFLLAATELARSRLVEGA